MRQNTSPPGVRVHRGLALGVPAAVAGSLTLLLGAAPAHADSAMAESPDGGAGHPLLRALAPESLRAPAAGRGATEAAETARIVRGPRAGAPRPTETAPSHVVVDGDTVSGIASAYGVRTADVLAINGLDWSSIIYPGQSLAIPLPGAAADPPPASAEPAPVAPVTEAATTHTVAAGDTISSIAAANGLSIEAVFAANGIGWSSIIYPGETLVLPGAPAFEPVADVSPVVAAAEAPVAEASPDLDAEQIGNAQIIIAVGRELGVSDRGIAIALGTAMQESWLRNLDWGDRDSLGLFQQRPSTGWGTDAEVSDPVRAARAFYGGPADPNGSSTRGLLDISGWEGMSFADAAQAVQISAFPDRYAQWEQPAYHWLAVHG